MSVLINKGALAKLNDPQKKVIMDAAAWLEAQAADTAKENAADIAKQKAAGIEVIDEGRRRRGLPRQSLRGRLGRNYQAEPGAWPQAEGVLRQGQMSEAKQVGSSDSDDRANKRSTLRLTQPTPDLASRSGPWGDEMDRLSQAYGRILDGLMLAACLLLLAMTLLIGADVVTRNFGLGGWPGAARCRRTFSIF